MFSLSSVLPCQAWTGSPPHFLLREEVDQAITILHAIPIALEAKTGCLRAQMLLCVLSVCHAHEMSEIMVTTQWVVLVTLFTWSPAI